MEYSKYTEEIRFLKDALKEAIEALREALSERSGLSPFPLYSTRQVAQAFGVSRHTVRDWFHTGLLKGRYHRLSGRACRLVFSQIDLLGFMDEHFVKPEDFSAKATDPRSSKAERLKRMFKMNKIYSRRRQRD